MSQELIKPEEIPNIIHAISGASGGVLSMLLTYPLITVSTQAQTKSLTAAEVDKNATEQLTEEEVKKNRVKKMIDTFIKIWQTQGMKGLFSGLESAMIGIGLTNFVYYYFYELSKKLMIGHGTRLKGQQQQKQMTTIQSMIVGCIAGCITVIATNPIWVANTRATVLHKEHKQMNTLQIVLKILREPKGLKQLFNGVLPALVLVLNPIIQYSFFEQCKNKLLKNKKALSPMDAFYLGALGKLVATGVTYPYITLKARAHLHNDHKSMTQLATDILKSPEGLKGFYNGIGVKLTQSILTAAFLFYFKEQLVHTNYKLYKKLSR